MPARAAGGDFRLDYSAIDAASPGAAPLTGSGCADTGDPMGGGAGQQLQAHGGQAWPGAQAGQAQAQPPPPEPLPASTGGRGFACAHVPVGHGVVMHSMLSEVQPHPSAVSAVHEVTSPYAVQGSAGGVVPQPHGAQAAPAGQAGQAQTGTDAEPVLTMVPDPPPEPVEGVVVVMVAPLLHAQLQAGHASPAGQAGQLQIQVPGPPPVPVAPPLPATPPLPVELVVPPLQPPPGWPQAQSQAAQTSPGRQAGQSQVQVPPPPVPLPASTGGGGGQSHCTGGQLPFAGQASGWTQRQPFTDDPRSKQKPPPSQL
jgi:hypothetical protein